MTSSAFPSAGTSVLSRVLYSQPITLGSGTTDTVSVQIPAGVLSVGLSITGAAASSGSGWAKLGFVAPGNPSGYPEYSLVHLTAGGNAQARTAYLDVAAGVNQVFQITNFDTTGLTGTLTITGYGAPAAMIKPPKPSYSKRSGWVGFEASNLNEFNTGYAIQSPAFLQAASGPVMLLGLDVDISAAPNAGGNPNAVTFWEMLCWGGIARAGSPAIAVGANDANPQPTTKTAQNWAMAQTESSTYVNWGPNANTGGIYPDTLWSVILKSAGGANPVGKARHVEIRDLEIPMVAGDQIYITMAAQTNSNATSSLIDGEVQIIIWYAVTS